MFHISDLKKYVRCPRMFHLENEADKEEFQPYVRLDEEVSALAAVKLGIGEHFKGTVGDDPALSLEAMKTYDWLIKARFEYRNLRVKVPFLHRNGNGWDLYFLFIGLYPKADDMQFYCDTVWVLRNNGIQLKDFYMIHLNGNYVRGKELDPDRLFVICNCFYNNRNNPSGDLKETILENMHDLHGLLREMEGSSLETLPPPVRTNRCTSRHKCRFYEACFPNEKKEPDNSITTLFSSQYRYQMAQKGISRLKDADISLLEGSRVQYAQIISDANERIFVDRPALRSWLSYLHYPIAFLDFEWERFAIPPYEGMRPYDVLPFEYSLDILYEDGTVRKHSYLSVHDDRRDLAKHLLADIPASGSVVAFNAEGAEMLRIEELAAVFPEYAERLRRINIRMEDLELPFETGTVYDVRMRGQWSLKTIMSMMDDPGYSSLDIREGMSAVFQWRHLDAMDENVDREQIRRNLLAYCGMDTHAMVVVYRWLKKLAYEDLD